MDAAISEDSDLIVYGVNVILKLNHEGDCDYIDLPAFTAADVDGSFLSSFLSFSWITRIEAAVLAGSDYNASIKGIGIKRAIKWLAK